jgi:hypothetical protein
VPRWRGVESNPTPIFALRPLPQRQSSSSCLADALCRLTGTDGVEAPRDALTALRLAPALVTQSTTSFEVEDWKRQLLYFFFRRFVLRAPFFAADFVFVFRFFAMLPS